MCILSLLVGTAEATHAREFEWSVRRAYDAYIALV
jgi:hypothetical protein